MLGVNPVRRSYRLQIENRDKTMRIFIFTIVTVLLCTTVFTDDAVADPKAGPSSSPSPMKVEEWERILKGFTGELKALQAAPVVSDAPDFKKTRRVMFSKYLQLYVRVSDAEKKHNDMGPYPAFMTNPFDSGEPLDHGPDIRGWGPYAIWDASTKDMEEKAVREEHRKANEHNEMNGAQFEFGVRLERFKDEVLEAMGSYCGSVFDLFEDNNERDAIIRENVADPGVRKVLEERLDWVRGDKK
jgi:hypothetical protein